LGKKKKRKSYNRKVLYLKWKIHRMGFTVTRFVKSNLLSVKVIEEVEMRKAPELRLENK
jgi:hypothetical protein